MHDEVPQFVGDAEPATIPRRQVVDAKHARLVMRAKKFAHVRAGERVEFRVAETARNDLVLVDQQLRTGCWSTHDGYDCGNRAAVE